MKIRIFILILHFLSINQILHKVTLSLLLGIYQKINKQNIIDNFQMSVI